MNVLVLLILASLAVATVFLAAFIWAVRSGQYEDTSTPSLRVLHGESRRRQAPPPRVGFLLEPAQTSNDLQDSAPDNLTKLESHVGNSGVVATRAAGLDSPA